MRYTLESSYSEDSNRPACLHFSYITMSFNVLV